MAKTITDADGNRRVVDEIDQGIQDVAQNAASAINEIKKDYDEACQRMIDIFLNLLNRAIDGLEKLLDFLDDAKKQIDDSYEAFEEFPSLPEFDLPDINIPDIGTEDLNCPFTECIGLPGPTVWNADDLLAAAEGLGDALSFPEDFITNASEFLGAMKEYGNSFAVALGSNAEIALRNAEQLLQNTPQAILNAAVDGIKAIAAGFIDEAMAKATDEMVDCMVAKDPRIGQTPEVIRYRELRKRVKFEAGQPVIDLGKAESVLGEFQDKANGIKGKLNQIAQDKALDVKDLSGGRWGDGLPESLAGKIEDALPQSAIDSIAINKSSLPSIPSPPKIIDAFKNFF
jgi:hypothetical protein